MPIPLNDLSRKKLDDIDNEVNLIRDILLSGKYLKGEFTKKFETIIAKKIKRDFVLGVSNGTESIKLALLGLGLASGDLIATVANAGGYTTSAAKSIGLRVGLVDIELENHQMSVSSLNDFIEKFPETKAVVVTHLYGQIGNILEIKDTCNKHNVYLIEDCAQSFGASLNGIQAGGFGEVATFSFYPTKNLGAAGDAGAVAFQSKGYFDLAEKISQYGWSKRYEVEFASGFNSRIDEIQAAILIQREKKLETENEIRRRIITKFRTSSSTEIKVLGRDDPSFVGHLAVVVAKNRDMHIEKFRKAGIETGIHYPILDCDQKAWRSTFVSEDIPNSKKAVNEIFTIPCFPSLQEFEIDQICNLLNS